MITCDGCETKIDPKHRYAIALALILREPYSPERARPDTIDPDVISGFVLCKACANKLKGRVRLVIDEATLPAEKLAQASDSLKAKEAAGNEGPDADGIYRSDVVVGLEPPKPIQDGGVEAKEIAEGAGEGLGAVEIGLGQPVRTQDERLFFGGGELCQGSGRCR